MRYTYKDGTVYTETSMNIMLERGHGRYKADDFAPTNHWYEVWEKIGKGEWYCASFGYATREAAEKTLEMYRRTEREDKQSGIIPECEHHEYDIREVVE